MGFRLRLWSFPCVASMKALPNRKGNTNRPRPLIYQKTRLNKSPSQKEGKSAFTFAVPVAACQPQ